jgi:hypothetical protein
VIEEPKPAMHEQPTEKEDPETRPLHCKHVEQPAPQLDLIYTLLKK